jgi:hypothetical protein
MATYEQIIQAIKDVCAKINILYSNDGDGRLTSAVKELEYLQQLQKGLKETHPSLTFEFQPVERWWWDCRVNGLTINLKLTTGGTDNAFNKAAIIYSISGLELEKKNMNYNQFFKEIKGCQKKATRDRMTEYHYLVVNKNTGKVLLKSILDIHTFKKNPSNDLQINWNNEFNHIDFVTPDANFKEKTKELLKIIQASVKQAIEGMKEFASADIDAEFA